MIKTFKHSGLEHFYRTDKKGGIDPKHAKRLRVILTALDAATGPQDLVAIKVHPLKYWAEGTFAAQVSGNWRLTFRFDGKDVIELDYLDYH